MANTAHEDPIAVPGFVDPHAKLDRNDGAPPVIHPQARTAEVVPSHARPAKSQEHERQERPSDLQVPLSRRAKRLFRIATLVLPSALAWYVAFNAEHSTKLVDAVTIALGPLWFLLVLALFVRTIAVFVLRRNDRLAQIDVLTGPGAALAWLSAFAIMCAVWLGWASLAGVGLLGTGVFHVVVLYSFIAFRAGDPMRGATITRTFLPEVVTEGDAVIEELRFTRTRIPIGFRLLASARIGARWATTRHVLDATESGAEVVIESDVGPALRGEHVPELYEVWLEDTFGICRSARTYVAHAKLTVLPRVRPIEKTVKLVDRGIGSDAPRQTPRLPTEGLFNLREYFPGDDVRRIHWVRSLAARELIVRLPDEIPPDRPRVRLVLDTFFPEVFTLNCDAPAEFLDALVGTWLAVARSLAESGVRVTLVAAVPKEDTISRVAHNVSLRNLSPTLRIGAQVTWQDRIPVDQLLTDEQTFIVSHGMYTSPPESKKVRWIVVRPTLHDPEWPLPSAALLPYPMGSAENRWSVRRRLMNELARERIDHARFVFGLTKNAAQAPPGSFIARPRKEEDGPIALEPIR